MTDPTREPGLTISQIFLREATFAHREDALTLPPATVHPNHEASLEFAFLESEDKKAIVVLVTAANRREDISALYTFRVQMAAVVTTVPGQENMTPREYATGPAIVTLYPFLREAVANLTQRGRFGPIWLGPINLQARLPNSLGASTMTVTHGAEDNQPT